MSTNRLEAFSDGVLAIIITIMVLELKVPHGATFSALRETAGTGLLSYLLSFVYVGIYWNNHHHTMQLTRRIDGLVLWANLGLLFVLSLLPFTTGWMDNTGFARVPVIVYGIDLLLAGVAYVALQLAIIRFEGEQSRLRDALGRDWKGKTSMILYLAGVAAAAIDPSSGGRIGIGIAVVIFVAVAVLWIVPDRRIDRTYRAHDRSAD